MGDGFVEIGEDGIPSEASLPHAFVISRGWRSELKSRREILGVKLTGTQAWVSLRDALNVKNPLTEMILRDLTRGELLEWSFFNEYPTDAMHVAMDLSLVVCGWEYWSIDEFEIGKEIVL